MNDILSQLESNELRDAIVAIQQPRTDFQIQHFVVGQHDTEPRRWMQCVLELSIKLNVLKRSAIERRKAMRKLAELELLATHGNEDAADDAELMRLDLEQHDLATVGAIREAQALYAIFKSFKKQYTHAELMESEAEYWQARLTRQAKHSLVATGRIGVGDLDSWEQIGQPMTTDKIRQMEIELCEPSLSGLLTATDSTPEKCQQNCTQAG